MLMKDLSVIFRFSRIYSMRRLTKYNLGHSEQEILMFLSKNDPVNQDMIAAFFVIDKGAVAKSLSKLEEKGYVNRMINPEDHREKMISLTPKGVEIMDNMQEILTDWHTAIYEGLIQEDIAHLERITSVIAANSMKAISKYEKI
ncbi:MarR family winged helix-turn-helix transcriptional regulator [Dehalobacter restrictus]|uniref:MarR family transcriptional regulator n=1 Tax=Dehalobacter restrictus (strain DSM 9455 / PER-K23) TaxID=871738 RepID=A0ABM5P5Y8_DEHRP|nr:MarR family winged helix-turn-helix transcriptional regulator [Dehalobacter restrictus]AHF10039.1 MarR family transcriptional regulator [Dehalobacter restrictus DSM 9455]